MLPSDTSAIPSEFHLLLNWWTAVDVVILYLVAFLLITVWVFRKWIARITVSATAWVAARFEIVIAPEVQEGVRPAAAGFCFALAAYISVKLLGLPGTFASVVEALVRLILLFTVFWLLNAFIQCAIAQWSKIGANASVIQKSWLPQFVRLLMLILLVVVFLKSWGIDLGPALTGLGIAGAAVALAAQDLIRNLIAGANIAGENRFQEGDWINFGNGIEGVVEKMQLRTTIIKRFDRATLHVPNAELANAPLTNYSDRSERQIRWYLSVPYFTDELALDAFCAKLSHYISSNEHFADAEDADHYVSIFALDESSIRIIVDCFVKTNLRSAELQARHELAVEIRQVFSDLGVKFAFPSRSIYVENSTDQA